jgi:N6-adenosine-specific RNA methylase IME4
MTDLILAKIDTATQMLSEIETVDDAIHAMAVADAVRAYAARNDHSRELVFKATEIQLWAKCKLGEILAKTPDAPSGPIVMSAHEDITIDKKPTPSLQELGIKRNLSSDSQKLAAIPEDKFKAAIEENRKAGIDSPTAILNHLIRENKRAKVIENLTSVATTKAKEIAGKYDVIVADPPWPITKIEREVAPEQVVLDYPTMELPEIFANLEDKIEKHAHDNCHVFIWTTQKYLPDTLSHVWQKAKLKYVLTFVWHKPGGFQPFGLPQYNCEFCVYFRLGTPEFIDLKDFNTCFNAPRGKHSEKPEEFYDMLRRVTAGRRLDLFNRRFIDGFDVWGNESK